MFILILLVILFDLQVRSACRKIQLIEAKQGYPKYFPSIGDPLLGLSKFLYGAVIKKRSDYYLFREAEPKVDKKFKSYTSYFFGIHSIITWNPDYCTKIFVKDKKNWIKVKNFAIFDELIGDSVVSVEGEKWKSQRKILNPSFSPSYIRNLVPDFIRIGNNLCDRLDEMEKKSGIFEPSVWMSKTTIDSLGTAGFGFDFDALNDKISEVYKAYEGTLEGFTNPLRFFPFYTKLPTKANKNYNLSVDTFWKWAKLAIDKKRNECSDKMNDLLDAMVSSHFGDSDGYQLSDRELLHNIFLFFLAGHETTSGTLTFVLDFLARNQDVQEKCRKEVIDKIGIDNEPTFDTIEQLYYINNVIRETMRLRPPVLGISRQAANDCELDGYFIPKGTMAIGLTVNLQLDADHWDDPQVFNPDRWNDNTRKGINFMPFGAGARLCLGMSFANLEMRIMLVKMLQRYSFTAHEEMKFERALTLRPQEGYSLKIKKL